MGAKIVHFDAHPDMSVPTPEKESENDVRKWNDANSLYYDTLSSEGCIAEFLIPMLYQNWISEMYWIKSPWCDQFKDGSYQFYCGNDSKENGVKVSLDEPYYKDDGKYTEKNNLIMARQINLHVISCIEQSNAAFIEGNEEWVLDICLDYFSTNNPFFNPLYNEICHDVGNKSRKTATDIMINITNLFKSFKYRVSSCSILPSYELSLSTFKSIMQSDDVSKLTILQRTSFLDLFINDHQDGMIATFFDTILPMLSRKTRNLIVESGALLLLPHHQSSEEEVDVMIENMKVFLRKTNRPSIITIARSMGEEKDSVDDDGFTRRDEANWIQDKVINALQNLLKGDNGRCKWLDKTPHQLTIHKFYEQEDASEGGEMDKEEMEDAYTKAYSMFLNSKAAKCAVIERNCISISTTKKQKLN